MSTSWGSALFTYRYVPLREPTNIRLLKLLPGSGDGGLRFTLEEVELDFTKQEYHAVSYAWGPAGLNRTIFSKEGCLEITRNLFDLLQQYILLGRDISLWVDAICINQNDYKERAQQILLMREIYSKSRRVFVWLGQEQPSDKQAFEFIKDFVDKYKARVNRNLDNSDEMRKISEEVTMSNAYDEVVCLSLTQLFSRSWFARAWTYQEIVAASDSCVSCGSLCIHFDYISQFAMIWDVLGLQGRLSSHEAQYNASQAAHIILAKDYVAEAGARSSLIHFVQNTRTRKATDPRDKIYSVVALTSDLKPLPYAPTYKVGVDRLYIDFAAHVISQNRNLDILAMCCYESGNRLPSWVPDWRKSFTGMLKINRAEQPFCASGSSSMDGSLAINRTSINRTLLVVQGILLEQIKSQTDIHLTLEGNAFIKVFDDQIRLGNKQKTLATVTRKLTLESPLYISDDEKWQAWWRTLVGGRRSDNTRVTDGFERTVWQYLEALDGFLAQDLEYESVNLVEHLEVELRLITMANGRRFCLTHSGRIGWIPGAARPGDVVTIFRGSAVPVLLRPHNGSYLVIGQCYIHGIMDGEAVGDTAQFNPISLV
ncbi:MAG: hypothetical protein Q9170_002558 [Blastenia crenularia]